MFVLPGGAAVDRGLLCLRLARRRRLVNGARRSRCRRTRVGEVSVLGVGETRRRCSRGTRRRALTGPCPFPAPASTRARPGPRAPGRPRRPRAPSRRPSGGARRRPSRRRRRSPRTASGRSRRRRSRRSSGSGESGNGQRIGWLTLATNRPPGRSTRATSASAPSTSATNGRPPNAEHATSTAGVGERQAPASACSSGTSIPVDRFSSAARASIPAERSSATTSAPSCRSHRAQGADPQPISSTRRPGTSPSSRRVRLAAPRGTRGSRCRPGPSRARPGRRGRRRPTSGGSRAPTPRPRPGDGRRRPPPDSRRCRAEGRIGRRAGVMTRRS